MNGRETGHERGLAPMAERAIGVGEQLVYCAIAVVLFASAVATVGAVGYDLVGDTDEGTIDAVSAALDGLLLAFILVELLSAVRTTVAERKLLAEPFLLVGIIVCIKEIVVASLALADAEGDAVDDGALKLGVLGLVVLLLAVSSFLIRRKEREPTEA